MLKNLRPSLKISYYEGIYFLCRFRRLCCAKTVVSNVLTRYIFALLRYIIDWVLLVNLERLIFIWPERKISQNDFEAIRNEMDNNQIVISLLFLENKGVPTRNFKISVQLIINFCRYKNYKPSELIALSRSLRAYGKLTLAAAVLVHLDSLSTVESAADSIDRYVETGATLYLSGKIYMARKFWDKANKLCEVVRGPERDSSYRILSADWFMALGHVAALGYYIKFHKLYRNDGVRVVALLPNREFDGSYLCRLFEGLGVHFIQADQLESDYDSWANETGAPIWLTLTKSEKRALVDEFFYFRFPDGTTLDFNQAFAAVQFAWDQELRPPLLTLDASHKNFLNQLLQQLGIPEGAWYVCLHVREDGYHKEWNALYPSLRSADLEDYGPAVEEIVTAGGWVVRMGDRTMKPIPLTWKGAVDYAHSNIAMATADISLLLGCRFFLGTNSGLGIIPGLGGVPSGFTNWAPLGMPPWNQHDVFMPKLYKNKVTNQLLSLTDIYEQDLAFLHNVDDLPDDVEVECNDPLELAELVRWLMQRGIVLSDLPDSKSWATEIELLVKKNGYKSSLISHLTLRSLYSPVLNNLEYS